MKKNKNICFCCKQEREGSIVDNKFVCINCNYLNK